MSQLKTNSITNIGNTGDDNIILNSDGSTVVQDLTANNVTATSYNTGQLAGFRNQLINSQFEIWQRGTPPLSTPSAYTADRWYVNGNVATVERQVFNNPPGTTFGFGMLSGGSGNMQCRQAIELALGEGTNKASPSPFWSGTTWTFSVWSTKAPSVQFAFADGVTGGNTVSVLAMTALTSTGETSGTYTKYSTTFTVSAAPDSANNLCLNMRLQYTAAAAGENWVIAGPQLEPGPVATPFENRPIGTELALCQRYYQKSYNIDVSPGANSQLGMTNQWGGTDSSGNILACVSFRTEMRTVPTIDTYYPGDNTGKWQWQTSSSLGSTTPTIYRAGTGQFSAYVTTGSNWVPALLQGHWTADAEL